MIKESCPLCGQNSFEPILYREAVPVHQNYLCRTQTDAKNVVRGTLDIQLCLSCAFVYNRAFELDKLDYSAQYENKQYCSPFFQDYLDQRIDYLLHEKALDQAKIVDIGCGQGHFLNQLIQQGTENTGVGFDPSYRGPLNVHERLHFVRAFYDGHQSQVDPDAVISRHVIEHVPDPRQLIEQLSLALQTSSKRVQIYFETPCIHWILRNQVIWDFFYEHCSYFSQETLARLFAQAGYTVMECEHIFGGQYLWLECEKSGSLVPKPAAAHVSEHKVMREYVQAYRKHEQEQIEQWQTKFQKYQQQGGFAIWGAGAKGVTMCNLMDPQAKAVECVIDINPQKQGHFIPGTGHPIYGPEHKTISELRTILLMNPNYYQECSTLVENLGLKIDFILE